jgi:serine/threonine-protein kinase
MLHIGGDGNRETLDLAAQALAQAEAINPNSPQVVVARGYFHYLGNFNYEQAMVEFRRAEKLAPNDPRVPEGMAYILRRMGDLDEALVMFHRTILLDPNNAHIHLHLAHTLNVTQQYPLAEISYDRSIALFPSGTEAYIGKAENVLEWRGSPEAAMKILEDANLEMNARVLFTKAKLLMYQDRFDDLAALLASAAPEGFGNRLDQVTLLMFQMDLALFQGDRQAALEAASDGQTLTQAILAEQPQLAHPYSILGAFSAVLGDRDSALEQLQTGMALGESDRFFFCGAISFAPRVYLLLGERDTAIDLLTENLNSGCFWEITRNDLRLDPRWNELRDDPRFQALLQDEKKSPTG